MQNKSKMGLSMKRTTTANDGLYHCRDRSSEFLNPSYS